MEKILLHPFALGFYTGTLLFLVCCYHLFRLKLEHKRYRKILGDKMEMDAAAVSKQKGELEALRKDNENLRVKVQALTMQPEQKLSRDLEVFARAEKKMTIAAPRTLFQRFFGGVPSEQSRTLPQPADDAAKQSAPGGT